MLGLRIPSLVVAVLFLAAGPNLAFPQATTPTTASSDTSSGASASTGSDTGTGSGDVSSSASQSAAGGISGDSGSDGGASASAGRDGTATGTATTGAVTTTATVETTVDTSASLDAGTGVTTANATATSTTGATGVDPTITATADATFDPNDPANNQASASTVQDTVTTTFAHAVFNDPGASAAQVRDSAGNLIADGVDGSRSTVISNSHKTVAIAVAPNGAFSVAATTAKRSFAKSGVLNGDFLSFSASDLASAVRSAVHAYAVASMNFAQGIASARGASRASDSPAAVRPRGATPRQARVSARTALIGIRQWQRQCKRGNSPNSIAAGSNLRRPFTARTSGSSWPAPTPTPARPATWSPASRGLRLRLPGPSRILGQS